MFVVSLLASSLCLPSFADNMSKHKTAHTKSAMATKWPQICPVSGEQIASAKDAVGFSVYKGKTYYFCCSMCKPIFDKDPAKYAAAAAKHKYLAPM